MELHKDMGLKFAEVLGLSDFRTKTKNIELKGARTFSLLLVSSTTCSKSYSRTSNNLKKNSTGNPYNPWIFSFINDMGNGNGM